jgi:hypothetical protein
MRRIFSLLAISPIVLVSIAILILASCSPLWLPDSSGFIYGRMNGSVALYDLKTKSERELIPGGIIPALARVALRPDGKQIAVARIKRPTNRKQQLHLFIYDLQGKPILVAEPFTFEAIEVEDNPYFAPTSCYWSPDGKRLLTMVHPAHAYVIYDIEQNAFRVFSNVKPFGSPLGLPIGWFDVNPILPDSSGFLAVPLNRDDVFLFDWAGNPPQRVRGSKKLTDPKLMQSDQDFGGVLLPTVWKDGKVVMSIHQTRLELDPQKLELTSHEDEHLKRLNDYANANKVNVVGKFSDGRLLQFTEMKTIELASLDEPEAKVLLKPEAELPVFVYPSPNGRVMLAHVLATPPRIVAFDSKGDILADITDKSMQKKK